MQWRTHWYRFLGFLNSTNAFEIIYDCNDHETIKLLSDVYVVSTNSYKIKSGVFERSLNRENNVNRKLYNTYHKQTTERNKHING